MSAPKTPYFSTLAGFLAEAFFSLLLAATLSFCLLDPTNWRDFSIFAYPVRASLLVMAAIFAGRVPVAVYRALLSILGRDDIDVGRYRRTYGRAGWAATWIFVGLMTVSTLWAIVRTPGMPAWSYVIYCVPYLVILVVVVIGWLTTVANIRL